MSKFGVDLCVSQIGQIASFHLTRRKLDPAGSKGDYQMSEVYLVCLGVGKGTLSLVD